jgi:VWFA-related protein
VNAGRTIFAPLLVLIAYGALAQTPAPPKDDEVAINVFVTGKNSGGRELGAADFSLSEDNKPQKIDRVSHPGPKDSIGHVILYFDLGGMSAADQLASATAAEHFVETKAGPGRYVAVAAMRTSGPVTVQDFTASADVLGGAIATAAATSDLPLSTLRIGPMRYALSDSFTATCRSLESTPGRKLIILFGTYYSEGGAIKACNRADVAIYAVVGWFSPLIGQVTEPPFIRPSPKSDLTDQTGGQAFAITTDLDDQLAGIAVDYDDYYRVFYTPPPSKAGSCHTLRVSVDAPGLVARARNEYCTEK